MSLISASTNKQSSNIWTGINGGKNNSFYTRADNVVPVKESIIGEISMQIIIFSGRNWVLSYQSASRCLVLEKQAGASCK